MVTVTRIDAGLHLIDLDFQGLPGIIGSYLLEDNGERVLIETGPTSTLPTLFAGLDELGVAPESIDQLVVTHIHLDHAGAAGSFIARFPQARLLVHEVGLPHMVDPSRLLRSATRIYGDMMDVLWGEFLPVPQDRIVPLHDGDVIQVGRRTLRTLYTPGHASHHVALYDEERGAVFTGDVAVVRLHPVGYIRPPTPPPDIDLEQWSASLDRIRELDARMLLLTHFGPWTDVPAHLEQARAQLYAWGEVVERALALGQEEAEMVDALRLHADRELLQFTDNATELERYEMAAPLGMSVAGYLRYIRKRQER